MVSGGENILDCCSAPGGKAVNLADKFNSVTATELHEHRVELIKSYLSRMNKSNITAMQADASVFNKEFSERFDAVLCDVPCSGTGVIKDNPDIKLRRDDNNIKELTQIQLKILNNASKYVKKGGYLYYSTCSIVKDENIGVVTKFLKENKDFTAVEIESKLNGLKLDIGIQFLPDISLGAGFYFAKLIKN